MNLKLKSTIALLFFLQSYLFAQQGFFLNTWVPSDMDVPAYEDFPRTVKSADVSVTIAANDTITRIPLYMFGDNANAYTSSMSENKTLMKYLSDREMGVLRGPSGSISDVYFWNRSHYNKPTDVPKSLVGSADTSWHWFGKRPDPWEAGWTMDIDSFYSILAQTGVTGMLTVNYGYARYGTSEDPVAQAAHLAADWVRYDQGRTKFWEIGNEVFGSWEAGYRINTALNKDGQPEYITGTLYGQHCRIFIDSMKAAAAEIGVEIFIGAVAAEASSTGPSNWNVGMMTEAGDVIDFYVIHSYYTPYNQNSNVNVILQAPSQSQGYMNYLQTCANQAGTTLKPVALTEYNTFAVGSKQNTSQIGGIFAVKVTGEAIKAGIGAACRWDLANGWDNGDDHGMYSYGDEPGVVKFSPRPAFYYLYFMQRYLGDVLVKTSFKGSSDITAYSSVFGTGHVSTTLVNSGSKSHVVRVNIDSVTIGERYYIHTLVGGTDVPADPLMPFSRKVYVNGQGPSGVAGGPLNYATIKAKSSLVEGEILVETPPYSVVYLLTDTGSYELPVNTKLYPSVQWNNPAGITYGTLLSPTQLNATASIPGTFIYDPPAGTKLNADTAVNLQVTFNPTDTATYESVVKSVKINVQKALPVIQWNTPDDIPAGTALDATQLNATSDIDGTFEYQPAAGTVLDTGDAQLLSVTFTPADTVNYRNATSSVTIDVFTVTGAENENAEVFIVYPVPASGILYLSNLHAIGKNKVVAVKIIGLNGAIAGAYSFISDESTRSIDISKFESGVYILNIMVDGKEMVKTIVKQ